MILGFMIILPIIVSSWLTMEMERWRDGEMAIASSWLYSDYNFPCLVLKCRGRTSKCIIVF
ncbi:MAG: hypothetical protein AAFR62_12735, partial [Cyanobacteria bacterium J06629_2]